MAYANILVVEDETIIALDIRRRLTQLGYGVVATVDRAETALEMLPQTATDLVLMDIRLRGQLSGIEAAQQIRKQFDLPVVFLTAYADEATLSHAKTAEPFGYIVKPFEDYDLSAVIEIALSRQQAEVAIESHYQQQLDSLRSSIALSLPHELRTPLTGILGSIELLHALSDTLEEPSQLLQIADNMRISVDRLHRLVQNFLFYAELELMARDPDRLKAVPSGETYNPSLLIKYVATQLAKQHWRETDLQMNLSSTGIALSEPKLRKVMEELISNAFKFSDAGTPVRISSTIDDTYFTVGVSNAGRGMTPEQVESVGAYVQFDRRTFEQQGSGLGLSIAKRLLELYGGRLAIDSTPGQQITVYAMFPCAGSTLPRWQA